MKKLHLKQFQEYLKSRPREFHKGDAGHILIVGGNNGYSGAVRLAGEAALRVGAGLVTVATRPEHAAIINLSRPELMCQGVNSSEDLEPLLEKSDVVVIGPGLGQTNWSRALLESVLNTEKLMLLDADALNLLIESPMKKENWILTPHPGEAGRLLKITSSEIQKDRTAAIKKLQNQFGGVCVLKGAGTLILGNDGEIAICEAGNPGMATAGMGDVLSGVIGGLMCQRIPAEDAAKLGVLIHAMAGDLAAKQGERGMIASDLLEHLRVLVNL